MPYSIRYSTKPLPWHGSEPQLSCSYLVWTGPSVQVIETVVGIAVINAAVSKAGPLEDEVFKLDIRYTHHHLLWMTG